MRLWLHIVGITGLFFANWSTSQGQMQTGEIRMQARSTKASVKLRWAPTSAPLWKLCNKYGYIIERREVTLNGKILQNGKRRQLSLEPVKPASSKEWLSNIEDENVATAAQAIFGESFEVQNESQVAQIVHASTELESRYSFALFAADNSPVAAKLAGLLFEDNELEPGVRYLYRIYANISADIARVDTASALIGLNDYVPLPKVVGLEANFGDRRVVLGWNDELTDRFYNCFWVERSDDGKTFRRITEKPIVNTYSGDRKKSKYIFRSDSLAKNNVKYYYRVLGVNTFGEVGPPSDTISGMGRSELKIAPTITDLKFYKDSLKISWTFPEASNNLIKEFQLVDTNAGQRNGETISERISVNSRSVVTERPQGSRYFAIRAVPIDGMFTQSLPHLVQAEDSIPPSVPENIRGSIDSTGHVLLNWSPNLETDLYGYVVFRKNFRTDDFIQTSTNILRENAFAESLSLRSLTEFVYYTVVAVDKHFNSSSHSSVLQLRKPDKIPPQAPVLKEIRWDSLGIFIKWIPSSSADVSKYGVYRRTLGEGEWTLINELDSVTTVMLDSNVVHATKYEYTVVATDDGGLESNPCMPQALTWIAPRSLEFGKVHYSLDRNARRIRLSWPRNGNMKRVLIYKSIDKQPFRLALSTDRVNDLFLDDFKFGDSIIEYRLISFLKNGERTQFSDTVTIKL